MPTRDLPPYRSNLPDERGQPEVSLASALHCGPGTYALLLRVGVPRTAGVPTGWEVTLDLVAKLADAEEETAPDPKAWYRERYGRLPNYSEVVNGSPTLFELAETLLNYGRDMVIAGFERVI